MNKPLNEDYMIRIRSRITPHTGAVADPDAAEDIELMTRGSCVRRAGSYYISYAETEATGYEGCVTTLKFAADGSRVALLRFGLPNENHTQLLVEKGRRNLCHYETGYGSLTVGVTADEIVCGLTEDGGTAHFRYYLDTDNANFFSENSLDVEVKRLH